MKQKVYKNAIFDTHVWAQYTAKFVIVALLPAIRGANWRGIYYLAIQRSVWRDIKFAFFCTVEDISTQDGAIGVKFWLRVEQTS